MKVVIVCGMNDEKATDKIRPFESLSEIDSIYLIRRQPLTMEKVISYAPPIIIRRLLVFAEIYRLFALFYVCLTKKPDAILGIYFVPNGIYAWITGKLFSIKVIQVIIGTDRRKIETSKCFISLLKNADHIVVRGETSKKNLSSLEVPIEKIFISPGVNAFDFESYRPSDFDKKFDLIYVGRLDKNKQVEKILKAVALLIPNFPDLRVAFVGDGPEREQLVRMAKQLNVDKRIQFVGNVPNKEIPKYLSQSKIFVMASDFEGLPVAMIEAVCCGLPVVVPNVGDILDVAKNNINGLVVDPPTVENFFRALSSLLCDEHLFSHLEKGARLTREKLIVDYSLTNAQEKWKQVLLL